MTLRYTHRAFPIVLLRAREAFMMHLRPVIAEHGCTEQQWRVLRILDESGPFDATALSARACLLTPSMTRILKALEERGLITRKQDGKDSRRLKIDISAKGRKLIASASPAIEAVYARLESAYGVEKMEALLGMLEELALIGEGARGEEGDEADLESAAA
ncbi:homoprotocatechuate degradation operon regulator HpaR [Afifella sp. IM 167]|uniref:homoprotocatechuate degradation operon regulator HpaR n=1 Tax=Afifella sp. IM 167 TaxID=2033586 RepID=UPI001CCF9061|nr:homoprotocatechuate degradation operon regulator HpaR [Afifella sp. IM 167]MBZ8132137.1 homoprotocatechuate degradation operon regulator HpaR [Afifella sp. IM 167]